MVAMADLSGKGVITDFGVIVCTLGIRDRRFETDFVPKMSFALGRKCYILAFCRFDILLVNR